MSTILETYRGIYVDYRDPQPGDILLEDVARQLSHICRFAGATRGFFSVAEHALHVRDIVLDAGYPELALAALHHDSHEAYLGDWPTPLKEAVGVTHLEELARKFDVAIGKAFGIDPALFKHPVVKMADASALLREASYLKLSQGVGAHWDNYEVLPPIRRGDAQISPGHAERLFIRAHYSLPTSPNQRQMIEDRDSVMDEGRL